jgi:hypothetical protein
MFRKLFQEKQIKNQKHFSVPFKVKDGHPTCYLNMMAQDLKPRFRLSGDARRRKNMGMEWL